MKRNLFWWGLLGCGFHVCGTLAAPVEGLPARLPATEVQKTADGPRWSFKQSFNGDYIGFHWLTEQQAYQLMDLSTQAEGIYARWIAAGRCPGKVKSSGVIQRLRSVGGSQAEFEVICERNNIQVEMRLSAPYLATAYKRRLEWQELQKWGINVILTLNDQ